MAEELKADRYQVEQEIGRGGMGVVLRARDMRLGRTVALKMLPAAVRQDSELRRRLGVEARAASAFSHPGVATVYDFLDQPEESFIVYEYVEGSTLREQMSRHRFTTEEVLEVGIQLADALAAAHERGIIHRDLKPENIMIVPSREAPGRAKILDFGLAKHRPALAVAGQQETAAATEPAGTAPGLLVGTVNYMAPEQLEGEPVDARTDLYALGLVLYEMTTGTNPFVGKTPTSTIANILKQEPPSMVAREPLAPPELDRIVRKCLRKRRAERYQSAREVWVDLSNLRRDSGAAPSSLEKTETPFTPPLSIARSLARFLLMLIEAGYLVMYGLFFIYLPEINGLRTSLAAPIDIALGTTVAALCGTPMRLYILSAVALDYLDLGRKFRWLFPALLLIDLCWAALPLLLLKKFGGLIILFSAGLAYLPFAQRTLVYSAYSPRGGPISGIQAPNPL